MHENLVREEEVEGSSDRSFGLVMAGAFLLVGLAPVFHGHVAAIRWWAIAVSAVFLAVSLIRPSGLAPLNRLWLRFGMLLSRIVSPIVLAGLYYLTVVPVGYAMRLSGEDPLKLRFDAAADSYWMRRSPPGPKPETMKNQF